MYWLIAVTNVLFAGGVIVGVLLAYVYLLGFSGEDQPIVLSGEAFASGLLAVLVACLLLSVPFAHASTLTMVTTPVKNIVGAVQEVAWYLAPVLLLGTLYHAHHGGIGIATLIEIIMMVLVIAIAVYAQDILAWIKPGAAAAATPGFTAPLLLWQEFGQQWMALAALTIGIRHVRHARRV
jgi:hypothetical protein